MKLNPNLKTFWKTKAQIKVLQGGRMSSKTEDTAGVLAYLASQYTIRVACLRRFQNKISESVYKTLKRKILEDEYLKPLFTINETSIKSLEGFDIAWCEESQSISKRSIELLLPTIRKKDSEVWFSWNPYMDNDPVETMINWNKDEDSICIHVNYLENPFIDDILIKEAERHKRNKPDSFDHVWLGKYATKSDSQIFKDKYDIKDFTIDESFGNPLFGMDFGFANDPTTGIKVYIKNDILYISDEAYKVGLELDDTSMYLKSKIKDIEKYVICADCARPESISYLKRNGLPKIRGVKKWSGSVIDGIEFIKSFDKIIIHPKCENTISEFRLYSYKIDKRTDTILPDVEDSNNHIIDAIRYALEPIYKKGVTGLNANMF